MLAAPVKLSDADITSELAKLGSGWAKGGDASRSTITKTYMFEDFHKAFAWMTVMKPIIDEADHHPEWFNVYNKVQVVLSTHDCGGLSEKDFSLASKMEEQMKK